MVDMIVLFIGMISVFTMGFITGKIKGTKEGIDYCFNRLMDELHQKEQEYKRNMQDIEKDYE